MKNISDQTGRAFEYAIVEELSNLRGVTLTNRAAEAQVRDEQKFKDLDQSHQDELMRASNALAQVMTKPPFSIGNSTVDRLTDNEAVTGDVTDIRITPLDGHAPINLSIKNNHHALKHQRPPSLMQQMGYAKRSPEDKEYRRRLQEVFDAFAVAGTRLCPGATLFSELKERDEGFINQNLYLPVCNLVSSTLQTYLSNSESCQTFFKFLVGTTNYIKVVLSQGKLEFANFSRLAIPTACYVEFSPANPSYIFLTFDNRWKISLRLHTASSYLSDIGRTQNTKFDTQPLQMPLEISYVDYR